MYSRRRSLVIFIIGVTLGALVLLQLIQPVRRQLAVRYVQRGDEYMANRDFDLAQDEYAKALALDPQSQEAKTQDDLAKEGQVDIRALRSFFAGVGRNDLTAKIDQATQNFTDPKQAAEAGVSLYSQHEYSLARYPLERAVAQNPGYAEAWHYLGLTYQELGKVDGSYAIKASQAFAKRDALTSKYLELETITD